MDLTKDDIELLMLENAMRECFARVARRERDLKRAQTEVEAARDEARQMKAIVEHRRNKYLGRAA